MSDLYYLIICICLIGTNILSVWYLQRQINLLIDKAMSRSYPEYVQTKNLEQVDRFPKGNTQEEPQINDDAVLNELNQILR